MDGWMDGSIFDDDGRIAVRCVLVVAVRHAYCRVDGDHTIQPPTHTIGNHGNRAANGLTYLDLSHDSLSKREHCCSAKRLERKQLKCFTVKEKAADRHENFKTFP
jgi:hypothetical protein